MLRFLAQLAAGYDAALVEGEVARYIASVAFCPLATVFELALLLALGPLVAEP